MITNSPTHLFVGSHLSDRITKELQAVFCDKGQEDELSSTASSCFCHTCQKIKNGLNRSGGNEHPSIITIVPEKEYKLQDLNVIFEKTRFALDAGAYFFFILKQAHLLTQVCANRLLKTLEEPPPGYIFILETNNEHSILPTIRSRCHIHHTQSEIDSGLLHPLLTFFVDPLKQNDPFLFEQELKKDHNGKKITEKETVELVHTLSDLLNKRIIDQQKNSTSYREIERLNNDKKFIHLKKMQAHLQKGLSQPPAPGGAPLFWKKLFMTFPRQ